MSFIDVPHGDTGAAKLYEENAYYEGYYKSPLGILQEGGCIYEAPEFKTAQIGDNTTINLFSRLGGVGRGENESLEGNEVSPARGTFVARWNELYQAEKVPSEKNIKQMRIRQDLFEGAVDRVFDWHKERAFVRSIFNQAAGNTATTITADSDSYTGGNLTYITGHNAATAPTSNRLIRAADRSTDEAVVSTDTHTLDMLDDICATIQSGLPEFQRVSDEILAIGFMHPKVMRDIKQDATGAIQWYPNALAFAQGGDPNDQLSNGTGANKGGYMYNELLIFTDYRVPLGVHSSTSAEVSNVFRSPFFGKNAIVGGSPYGLSLDGEDVPLELSQESFDYARFRGVAGGSKCGFKKFVGVEGEDNNVFVTVAYAA